MRDKREVEEVKDSRLEVVKRMLRALELEIDDETQLTELSKIKLAVMVLVEHYCLEGIVEKEQVLIALNKVLETTNENTRGLSNVILNWPGEPITQYVQETIKNQFLVLYREGGQKSFRLILLSALLVEFDKLKTIENINKINIAKAFLNKALLSDNIWNSGENGKKAIELSLIYFNHVENVLSDPVELRMIRAACDISSEISTYRSSINGQWFGRYRQGNTNLEKFNTFLNEINEIVQNLSLEPVVRVKLMLSELNKVPQSLDGTKSSSLYQNIFNMLIDLSKELQNMQIVSVSEQESSEIDNITELNTVPML